MITPPARRTATSGKTARRGGREGGRDHRRGVKPECMCMSVSGGGARKEVEEVQKSRAGGTGQGGPKRVPHWLPTGGGSSSHSPCKAA